MVYRPDGSGRDMYVLGPRSTKGPQIVDVAARATSSMNREANRKLLNASLLRTDNKVPNDIPTYEMKALISRKIADRQQATQEAATLAPAKLTLNAAALSDALGGTMSTGTRSPLNATRTAADLASATVCPLRYNSGLAKGGNSPTSPVVLNRPQHHGAANSFFTTSQRGPSTYVSPKTPSNRHTATGRVGGSAYDQALETVATVASLGLGGSRGLGGTLGGSSSFGVSQSLPSSPRKEDCAAMDRTVGSNTSRSPASRRSPSAGFVLNKYLYESTQERANRTGRTFQPYEAPEPRAVLPEIRARYSNM